MLFRTAARSAVPKAFPFGEGFGDALPIINVGAIIDRPRGSASRIRPNQCEYVTFMCRAINDRPYGVTCRWCVKLQFTAVTNRAGQGSDDTECTKHGTSAVTLPSRASG